MSHEPPREYLCRLDGSQETDLILILDASQSAAPRHADLMRLALATLAELPAAARAWVWFLGNPHPYPASEAPAQISTWFAQNSPRASLITPVLEALASPNHSENKRKLEVEALAGGRPLNPNTPPAKASTSSLGHLENTTTDAPDPSPDAPLLILGDGEVYDLDDWRDSPFWPRLRLVNCGVSLQSAGTGLPELTAPSPQSLRQWLYDPVTAIDLSGAGFLPLAWDSPAYCRGEDQGTFTLSAGPPPPGALTIRCLLCPGATIEVQRRHASGLINRHRLAGEGGGLAHPTAEPAQGRLTATEVAILDLACQHRDFTCPHCRSSHPWDTLRCRCGRALIAQPVYPSLADRRGFIALQRDAQGAAYRLLGDALALDDGLVAIREDTCAVLRHFDPDSARWLPANGAFQPYQPLGMDGYALLL